MQNPIGFLIALGVGSVVTALLLVALKKDAVEKENEGDDEIEEEVDLSGINIK
jgi:PTS system fructose-specific IIC component